MLLIWWGIMESKWIFCSFFFGINFEDLSSRINTILNVVSMYLMFMLGWAGEKLWICWLKKKNGDLANFLIDKFVMKLTLLQHDKKFQNQQNNWFMDRNIAFICCLSPFPHFGWGWISFISFVPLLFLFVHLIEFIKPRCDGEGINMD